MIDIEKVISYGLNQYDGFNSVMLMNAIPQILQ